MKKLVVIATAAALAAGISFANAQSSSGSSMSNEKAQAADKMQKSEGTKGIDKSGMTTGSGAATTDKLNQEKSNPGSQKPDTSTENKGAAGKGN